MNCCFCKEYANPIESQYYNELGNKINVESRIIMETENWYVIPTLGCFTVGYVLLVCKKHYLCMATLSEELFLEMLALKDKIEQYLYRQLGYSCLTFEHGTTNLNESGANSVDHVHIHLVPFTQVIWPNISRDYNLNEYKTIASYESLFLSWKTKLPNTYLLFQDVDKTIYYLSDFKGIPSQFFRKCLASYIGISQWDWKQENFQINFLKTLELFKTLKK